jgi:hypothetical protein
MAGAVKLFVLLLIIDGTGEMSTFSAVSGKASIGQPKQDRLIFGGWVIEMIKIE